MKTLLKSTLACKIIEGKIRDGRTGHAYLLVCEDEAYLRSALRFFASLLYHGDTRKTTLIERECFTDCLYYPEEGKKLTVDCANEIVEQSIVRPMEGDTKIFVLDGFHLANGSVQNKLLKVLEEPPEGVIFLLGTISTYPILPTILSRVEKLELPLFSEEDVFGFLKRKYEKSEGELRMASSAGCGRLSRAEAFLSGGVYADAVSLAVKALGGKDIPVLAMEIDSFGNKEVFLSVFKTVCRDAMLPSYSMLGQKIGRFPTGALVSAIELISETEREVKQNANYRQAVELLLVRINKEKEKWSTLS